MKKDIKKLLKKLVEVQSPSGFEEPAAEIYRDFVKEYADEVSTDVHGNVVATKKGTGDVSLMICGHIDEIGMMINYIDDNGFISFSAIGGVDAALLPGLTVNILHEGKKITGVIGRKAIHLQDKSSRGNAPKMKDLWIDIGAKDKKDAEKRVAIGDIISFNTPFQVLNKDIISAKGTDDKVGVAIAALVLKELAEEDVVPTIHSVASVQEEVGLRGARTSSYSVDPDVAICLDVTHATDIPGVNNKEIGDISLGNGPAIAIGASINKKVFKMLKDSAKNSKIDIQIEAAPSRSGTDTDIVQISRGGIATGLISIPNRYMHTPNEVISLKDVVDSVKLIVEFIRGLNDEISFIPGK